jgi:hypothetical protein
VVDWLPVSTSRPVGAALSALVIVLCVAACGSDSNPSSGANTGAGATQPGNGRRGILQDPKVVACLKPQGVAIPGRPRPGNGQPPASGRGRPNRRLDSAQFQKLREALQKCGVDFRGGPPNGQPPDGQGTTSTSAS